MYDNIIGIYNAFKNKNIEEPLLETLRFVDILSKRAVTDIDRITPDKIEESVKCLNSLAKRRKEGEPLEYIIGEAPFFGEMFYCSQDTLIPREETELLVKVALDFIWEKQKIEENLRIVDIGTGSGNIAISIALNTKNVSVLAADLNPGTIEIAEKNVKKFYLEDRISLFQGDLFAPMTDNGYERQVDIVVCNPPYIPTGSLKKMPQQIIDFEPREAFDGGPYGFDFFRRLLNDSKVFLKRHGILVFEIGAGQEKLMDRLFKMTKGYENIQYFDDGEQIRVISAVRKPA